MTPGGRRRLLAGALMAWRAATISAPASASSVPAAPAPPALTICATDIPPVAFQGPRQAEGMAVELARAIQDRLGRHEEIRILPWGRAFAMVDGTPNVLVLGMVRTPAREQAGRITFVGPLFTTTAGVYARRGEGAALRALGPRLLQKRIGARRSAIFAEMARQAGYVDIDQAVNSETAAKMLMRHRFDLWVDGSESVPAALRHNHYSADDVELVTTLGSVDVYFAFSAGTPAAVSHAWEGALRALKREGRYQAIYRKWFFGEPARAGVRYYPGGADAVAAASAPPH